MPRTKIEAMPGWNSKGHATLEVTQRVYDSERSLDYENETLALYELQYLPDTNEVALVKGDGEIVYSELVI